MALDQRDDELDDVLSGNLLQRGVSRGPPRAMTHQDALLQNIRNSAESDVFVERRRPDSRTTTGDQRLPLAAVESTT